MGEKPKFLPQDPDYLYKSLHVGREISELNYGALVQPISVSANHLFSEPGVFLKEYEYGRMGNPTRTVLEKCLASLDNAKYCLTYCSGMAAITSVLHLFKNGDHFVAAEDIYGTIAIYMREICTNYGITTSFVDAKDPQNVINAIQKNTKMVFLETPTNPLMNLIDIKTIADLCHKKNSKILVFVDNTFTTSYFQKPMNLGADLVIYSLSKFYNGHSDVIMGAAVYNDDMIHQKLKFLQKKLKHNFSALGIIPSPFDCYLANRSLKTLKLRMDQHMENGLAVARFLEKHKAVEKVLHPGLPSHPQHDLALRQCSGHSSIFSFYIKGGEKESRKLVKSIKGVFLLAESFGGFESLLSIPSLMTHSEVTKEIRDQLGITDNLIRISVGLDPIEDLIKDLDQALNKAFEK